MDWRRILMGFSLLLLMIPVVAVAAPRVVDGLEEWMKATDERLSDLEQRVAALEGVTTVISATTTTSSPSSTTTDHAHTTSSTALGEVTTSSTSTTTTTSATTTEATSAPSTPSLSGDTITGTVCPCTVTGTATLKAEIDLQGDIVVDGGTLIARPGVDLNGNGFQIMFMNGGTADFQGTPVFTWSNNGAVQNLARDINFRNLQRIMFHMGAGPSVIKYVAIHNSGTPNLDDYSLHWHLNHDSTRGTLVEGVVVVGSRNHSFVPHGSHGITFRDTIAKNGAGAGYWWNPPGSNPVSGDCDRVGDRDCTFDNSNDIVYDHALADNVTRQGFELTAGSGNAVINSAAINTHDGGTRCSGFQWPSEANMNKGGNTWLFRNNFASAPDCHGIRVWQNDGNPHVVDGFAGGGILHGAYGNHYKYRNVTTTYLEIHAAGWVMSDSHIDTLIAFRHRSEKTPTVTMDNVTVGTFTIANAENGGDVPGLYVLNGSGLTCSDIIYESVVPGTVVVLDGVTCDP